MRRLAGCLAASVAVVTSCGGSSGGEHPPPVQAPRGYNYTQVTVKDVTIDVTETKINGYTCLVGVNDYYDRDYSPTLWCDPNKGATP